MYPDQDLTIHKTNWAKEPRHFLLKVSLLTEIRLILTLKEMYHLQDNMEINFAQIHSAFTIRTQSGATQKQLNGDHHMIDLKDKRLIYTLLM